MKLLVDACVPAEWVGFLRTHGHNCESWLALGAPNAPDSEIMHRAFADGRVVLAAVWTDLSTRKQQGRLSKAEENRWARRFK